MGGDGKRVGTDNRLGMDKNVWDRKRLGIERGRRKGRERKKGKLSEVKLFVSEASQLSASATIGSPSNDTSTPSKDNSEKFCFFRSIVNLDRSYLNAISNMNYFSFTFIICYQTAVCVSLV